MPQSKTHVVDNRDLLERFVAAHEKIAVELGNISSGLDLVVRAIENNSSADTGGAKIQEGLEALTEAVKDLG